MMGIHTAEEMYVKTQIYASKRSDEWCTGPDLHKATSA